MFAGSATGGIPASGTDKSATGPATCQVTAGSDAERTGDARPAFGWGTLGGAESGECDAGRKITTAAAATTATDTPPNHTRRRACRSAGRPTLPMPVLSAPPQPAPQRP